MTYDEADKIAAIIATADSGCPSCVGDMCEQFNEAFPAFVWEMDKTRYFVTVRPASDMTSEPQLPPLVVTKTAAVGKSTDAIKTMPGMPGITARKMPGM